MLNNNGRLVNSRQGLIKCLQKTFIDAGLSIEADNELLRYTRTHELPLLNKCLEHLVKNNCLTLENFKKLFLPSCSNRKHFYIPLKLRLLKELDRKRLLNQHNLDAIFDNPVVLPISSWKNLVKLLLNEDLMTQANLDKILLHTDVLNLLKITNVFYPLGHNSYNMDKQDFLDKIMAQNNLGRFEKLLAYIPDSIWINSSRLSSTVDKLILCNKKLGDHKLSPSNESHWDYATDETGLDGILERCNQASSSKEAANIFNYDVPAPLPTHIKYADILQNKPTAMTNDNSLSVSVNTSHLAMLAGNTNNFLTLFNYSFFKLFKIKNNSNTSAHFESIELSYEKKLDELEKKVDKKYRIR